MAAHNLIFDADDTLWENNVLFERAIDAFIAHVDHPTLPPEEVRAVLNDIERANSAVYGYGAAVFERSLTDCLAKLHGTPLDDADRSAVHVLSTPVREHAIELIGGVAETLAALAPRHRLFLLTKGPRAAQQAKVDASGLAGMFHDVEIVPEKDASVYRAFAAERALDPARTWMIGNSPRSDVLPALEAGLGAVFVPHPMTWSLEHADVPDAHDRFHEVAAISALVGLF